MLPGSPSPSCSVVVPVRDDEEQLAGLLQALSAQTRQPLEVIVVDNGSVDGSAARARAAGCTVVTEPVPGIAAAAAAGYDAARGELIVRCDADSRPPPGWLAAHQDAHLREGPSAVIVTGPGRFTLPPPLDILTSALYLGGYMLATAAALGHWPAFGTTMSMDARWWREVREQVSRSAEVHDDMDLSFRVRPGEHIALAWAAGVAMSPRALRLGRGAGVRWRRAVATLRRNWRGQATWERWTQRWSGRQVPAGGTPTRGGQER